MELSTQLQADKTLSAYVLIDPLVREPFDEWWLEELDYEATAIPVRSDVLRSGREPRLIRLEAQNVELFSQSLLVARVEQSDPYNESFRGFSIGGWLVSAGKDAELARHLGHVMDRSVFMDGRWRYFRWADRRVLEWMWPVLTSAQQKQLLGPIAAWRTLDRHGAINLYTAPDDGLVEVVAREGVPLTMDQLAHAQHCELIQNALRGWHAYVDELPADYRQTISQAFGDVMKLDINNPQDISLLLSYAVQIHPRLCSHPHIKALNAKALNTTQPLATVLAAVTTQEWDAIQSDLNGDGMSQFRPTFK